MEIPTNLKEIPGKRKHFPEYGIDPQLADPHVAANEQRDVGKFLVCFMKICTCSSTGGILARASHVPKGPSQRPPILQFTN